MSPASTARASRRANVGGTDSPSLENSSRRERGSASSSGAAGRTSIWGLGLAFEGVDGEPGDRLDGCVYLLIADIEVGTQAHGALAPGRGEHALAG